MKPSILCLERLERIQRVLARVGGDASMRDLWRRWEIYDWEIEQVGQLGWVKLYTRKPSGRGRPSRRVKLCGGRNAKLPLPRRMIPRLISYRHEIFAMWSVYQAVPRGIHQLGVPGVIHAYLAVYHPKSHKAAHASCSRLMKNPDVRAARQWFYAKMNGEVPKEESMPRTRAEIRLKLAEAGSWRAPYIP